VAPGRYCLKRSDAVDFDYRPVDKCLSSIVDECLCGNHAEAYAAGDVAKICDAVFNVRRRIGHREFLMKCGCKTIVLKLHRCAARMGEGEVVMSDIKPTGWEVPPPDTAAAQTMNQVCAVALRQADRLLMACLDWSTRLVRQPLAQLCSHETVRGDDAFTIQGA
jgi:hypothetical protein